MNRRAVQSDTASTLVALSEEREAADQRVSLFPLRGQGQGEGSVELLSNADVSDRSSPHAVRNQLARALWNIVWLLLFRPSPRILHGWRRMLLRLFGARIGAGTHIYPGAVIWAPWNLQAGKVVAIADSAEIYNPAPIKLGDFATISQGAYLCAASHDYTKWEFPLVTQPIVVENHAWIAARAIVHMGVTVGEGSVIGAGSVVTKDTPRWTVCAGNPCRVLKHYEKSHD
jgi:putative colanic acid biosynthesis acetyltransferase WcaF